LPVIPSTVTEVPSGKPLPLLLYYVLSSFSFLDRKALDTLAAKAYV
jgi:hypothetical protein